MLTEKQKQEIVCRVLGGESKNSVAKSFNNLRTETALDMVTFLGNKKGQVQDLISLILDGCKNKVSKASLKDSVNAIKALRKRTRAERQ